MDDLFSIDNFVKPEKRSSSRMKQSDVRLPAKRNYLYLNGTALIERGIEPDEKGEVYFAVNRTCNPPLFVFNLSPQVLSKGTFFTARPLSRGRSLRCGSKHLTGMIREIFGISPVNGDVDFVLDHMAEHNHMTYFRLVKK
jgi:hypothetical protein